MASTASPHGARPVGSLVSCAYNAKITHYKIKNNFGTSIFYGDFVKWADDNPNTIKDTGTTSATPIGVFLGCAYTDPTTGQFTPNQYYPASTAADDIVAYVASDPFFGNADAIRRHLLKMTWVKMSQSYKLLVLQSELVKMRLTEARQLPLIHYH